MHIIYLARDCSDVTQQILIPDQ